MERMISRNTIRRASVPMMKTNGNHSASPSFFLFSSSGENDEDSNVDAGGTWTKVRTKKALRKHMKRAIKSNNEKNDRKKTWARNKQKPNQQQQQWRVPHNPQEKKSYVEVTQKHTNQQSQRWSRNQNDNERPEPSNRRAEAPRIEIETRARSEPDHVSSKRAGQQIWLERKQNELGSNHRKDRGKLRLKLWNILFRNMNRAVDELYYMCEFESSQDQCNEAVQTLEMCIADFNDLAERIKAQDDFTKLRRSNDSHDSASRAIKGFAWEVRKPSSSPSPATKMLVNSASSDALGPRLDNEDVLRPETDEPQSSSERNMNQVDLRVEIDENHPITEPNRPFQSAWVKKPRIIPDPKRNQSPSPKKQERSDPSSPSSPAETKPILLKTEEPEEPTSANREQENGNQVEKTEPKMRVPKPYCGERWGDEIVGLSKHSAALLYPKSPPKSKATTATRKDQVVRTLHQKLSSPERRKPSPYETRRRQVEKQATAQLNREKLVLQRQARLKLHSSRQQLAAKVIQEGILAQERALSEKLERAAVAREANLKKVAKKAENESLKVNEIQFINEMTELDKEAQIQQKLQNSERRRLKYIGTIREKAEKQSERAQARKLREQGREKQLREAMQKRHEEAEKRKAEAWEEQKRRLEEMHVEAPAKVSERRTEMEKEREARLHAIKEREERAEMERRKLINARRVSMKTPVTVADLEDDEEMEAVLDREVETYTNHPSPKSDVTATRRSKLRSASTSALSSTTYGGFLASTNFSADAVQRSGSSNNETNNTGDSPQEAADGSEDMGLQPGLMAQKEASKQMKKRARKVRGKINSLCLELKQPLPPAKASILASKIGHKLQKSLRGLAKPSSRDGSIKELARLFTGTGTAEIRFKDVANQFSAQGGLDLILSMCNRERELEEPGRAGPGLKLVATVCIEDVASAKYLVTNNMLVPIIDLAVWILRDSKDDGNSPSSTIDRLPTLIGALRLIRAVIVSASSSREPSDESRARMDDLVNEIIRYCVCSTLLLRFGERCEQLRSGGQWMGCSLRVANKTAAGMNSKQTSNLSQQHSALSTSMGSNAQQQPQQQRNRGNWNDASASEFETAITLFGHGFALIEAMLLFRTGADEQPNPALIQAAKTSSIFEIVSSLTTIYFAVRAQKTTQFGNSVKAIAHIGLRIVNLLALVQLEFVQQTLGSPTIQFEFQQLLRYVLSSCCIDGSKLPSPPQNEWHQLQGQVLDLSSTTPESLFAELVVLMGFYAQCNQNNQESLHWGRAPTPLRQLCCLPFKYFSSPCGKSILLPTMVSICFRNPRAVSIIEEDCSPALLATYIKEQQQTAAQASAVPSAFETRFPRQHWDEAVLFFSATTPTSSCNSTSR